MNTIYRQTIDQIQMSDEAAQSIRAALASRSSQSETEELNMKNETHNTRPILRRSSTLLVAALLICALSISALAYGGVTIYQMLTGGTVNHGEDADGTQISSVTMNDEVSPVEVREGRLYLTINGEDKDITDECSYTEPYIYECVAADGLRHSFIIGGSIDAIGWAEFVWDEDNMPTGGSASFGTPAGSDDAPWFAAGKTTLGLPW